MEQGDSPQVVAAAKELIRQFPHLDYLMASTIAWHELEKKPMVTHNAGFEDKTAISGQHAPQSTP